jgi:hypothetical protein
VRPPHRPAAVTGAAAAALGLAIAAAATGGSWSLEERHYGSFRLHLGGDPVIKRPVPKASAGTADPHAGSGGLLGIDGRWFLLLLAVLIVVAVVYGLRRLWQRFRATAPPPGAAQVQGAGGVLAGDPEPELPPLLAASAAALAALDRGTTTSNAIVAAWVAVEAGAAQSGVPRGPAQTATEFTVAVLRRTQADPDAIAALRALYLRARFSAQTTSRADVAEAARCIRVLAEGWAVTTAASTAAASAAAISTAAAGAIPALPSDPGR